MQDHTPAPPVDLDALARRIAERSGVPTSAADIERVMAALLASADFWEIVGLAGRPVGQVAETLAGLGEEELARRDGTVALTPAGTSLGWARALVPRKRFRCPHCAGRGLALDVFRRGVQTRWEKVRSALGESASAGDEVLSLESVLGLVAFLADRGDLMGKAVLVLDDPSLVGVALAGSGFPKQVTVLEPDAHRAQALREVVTRERIALEVRPLPPDGPLPAEVQGGFTTLVLGRDPGPEDAVAQVRRGLAGLRGPGSAVVHGLSSARVSLAAWADLERRILAGAPLMLTDLLRDALEHDRIPLAASLRTGFAPAQQPPSGPWYRSTLVRWEALPGFDPARLQEGP